MMLGSHRAGMLRVGKLAGLGCKLPLAGKQEKGTHGLQVLGAGWGRSVQRVLRYTQSRGRGGGGAEAEVWEDWGFQPGWGLHGVTGPMGSEGR